jgi:hypothetical protein
MNKLVSVFNKVMQYYTVVQTNKAFVKMALSRSPPETTAFQCLKLYIVNIF